MGTISLNDYEDVQIWAPWGNIAGRWYGNRVERPILAIHGWLDNLGTFDTLIPLLPDYLGVLCIDLPGHGLSAQMPHGIRYSVTDYVYIIARVIKEYKWTKVSLMGHSMGGYLCFMFASLAPHMVDMMITLDIVKPVLDTIVDMQSRCERHLLEVERAEENSMREPPSYTLAKLHELLGKGFNKVPPEFANHILARNVTKSQLYPDRFYFSRDGRIKYISYFQSNLAFIVEMARRLKKTPYLVIKGSDSPFINPDSDETISILKEQNPHFELHEVQGPHYVHLINAKDCARHIVPFLRRHRPLTLASWSLGDEETILSQKERRKAQRERRKAQEEFFVRNKKQKSKL